MNEELKYFFAKSLAGHDKGSVYVILNKNLEYVYLSDGKNKTIDKPKKKKLKHVQIEYNMDSDIESKKNNEIALRDEDIRRAIKKYLSEKSEV